MKIIATLGLMALAVMPAASHVSAIGDTGGSRPVGTDSAAFASYNGSVIDLRVGWGTAKACLTDGKTTECFDSEQEMRAEMPSSEAALRGFAGAAPSAFATCSSSVYLYSGTNYTGSVLGFTSRFTLYNLSSYGFDNVLSSYKIGACSSTFYDGAGAGAPIYPGNTSAGVQFPGMLGGWNNRIGSIYIA